MTTPRNGYWPVEQSRVDRNWRAVLVELDAPVPGRVERLLRRAGLPAHVTRLVVATPALRRAWFLATGLAILLGLASSDPARPRDNLFVLLLIAPLVPVMGVTLAYGAEADPAHEMALATPLRGLRLILTRAAAVLGFSTFWLTVAAVLAPGTQPMAFAWLLPALGLTTVTVALMTVFRPRVAGAVSALTWVAAVGLARAVATDPLVAFGLGGQLTILLLTAASLALAVARRDRFDLLELRS